MRFRTLVILGALVAFCATALVLPGLTYAQDKAPAGPKYIGVAACKPCHQGAAKGTIYEVWLATPHAKAFEVLGAENQKNVVCLGCHSTGHGKTIALGKTAADLQGVQCEACHGPGSEYKAIAVMKVKAEAIKKGLVVPTEKTCLGCHAGTFPDGHAKVAKFEFATAVKKIEHHSAPAKK
jgi:hypothetical protein